MRGRNSEGKGGGQGGEGIRKKEKGGGKEGEKGRGDRDGRESLGG